jgi:tetratricopeptide (TPR) repeat protein
LIFDSILKFGYGQLAESLQVGRQALEAFRKNQGLWDEATLLGFMCTALFNTGQYEEAERLAQKTYQLGERVGNYGALWFANMTQSGYAMLIDGDLDRYESMIDREKVIAPRAGFVFMGEAATHQGMVKFLRGEWESALEFFEEGADLEMPGAFGGNSSMVPLCLAYLGRREEALRKLQAEYAKLPASGGPVTLTHLSAAAGIVETLSILGERQHADALDLVNAEVRSRGLACTHFTGRTTLLLGAMSAVAASDWGAAEQLFDEATREAEAIPLRGARPDIRRFHAMALLERGEPADRKRAVELLDHAVGEYRQMGMQRHAQLAEGLLVKAGGGVIVKPAGESRFKREGDVWTVAFDGQVTRVKHGVGLAYLAHLLARPGTEVHVMDLVGAVEGTGAAPRATAPTTSEREAAGINTDHTYEAVLDATARNAYKSRLRELQAEIERAERDNDPERASRARTEFDFLAAELTGAMGLGGRTRTASGSSAERARVSVTKAVKAALKRIDAQHPALGKHLERTVHTGAFCAYTPDPRAPIDWIL